MFGRLSADRRANLRSFLSPTFFLLLLTIAGRAFSSENLFSSSINAAHSSNHLPLQRGTKSPKTGSGLPHLLSFQRRKNESAVATITPPRPRDVQLILNRWCKFTLPTLYASMGVAISGAILKMSSLVGWYEASYIGTYSIFGWMHEKFDTCSYRTQRNVSSYVEGCKEITCRTHPKLHHAIQIIAKRAGLSIAPKSFINKSRLESAYVIGFPYVEQPPLFLSQDEIDTHSEDELRAIIAHEFAHLHYSDSIVMNHIHAINNGLSCNMMCSFVKLLMNAALSLLIGPEQPRAAVHSPVEEEINIKNDEQCTTPALRCSNEDDNVTVDSLDVLKIGHKLKQSIRAWLASFVGTSALLVLGRLFQRAVSRGAEYRADAFAAKLVGHRPTITMLKRFDDSWWLKLWPFLRSNECVCGAQRHSKMTKLAVPHDTFLSGSPWTASNKPACKTTSRSIGCPWFRVKDVTQHNQKSQLYDMWSNVQARFRCFVKRAHKTIDDAYSTHPSTDKRIQAIVELQAQARAEKQLSDPVGYAWESLTIFLSDARRFCLLSSIMLGLLVFKAAYLTILFSSLKGMITMSVFSIQPFVTFGFSIFALVVLLVGDYVCIRDFVLYFGP